MVALSTDAGSSARRRVFRPEVRLRPRQVHDLRRMAPMPSPSNPGGTRRRTEQRVYVPASAVIRGRHLKRAQNGPATGGTKPALKPVQRTAPRDYMADLQKGGQMASVVRALTAQVPGAGAPIPMPIPARIALALGSFIVGESYMRPRPARRVFRVKRK